MKRRRLLSLLAGGAPWLAGCSSGDRELSVTPADVPETESPTPAGSPSQTPTTNRTPTASETPGEDGDEADGNEPFADVGSLVELETVDRTLALTTDRYRTDDGARVGLEFAETATGDSPARIAGTFENANGFENTFRLHWIPPFSAVSSARPGGQSGEEGYTYRDELYLAPTENHDFAAAVPEYERDDGGRWRLAGDVSGPWISETIRLAPGETRNVEYVVLGHPEGEGFPTEQYTFERGGEASVTIGAWQTSEPGPTDGSRFGDASPPSLPGAEAMAWYHGAGSKTTAYLRPSAERAELPAAVDFTLVNHGRTPLSGNPYFWKLHKLHDGEWFHVAPWGWPAPLSAVPPGGKRTWTLRAFPEHAVPCDDGREAGFLGGGRYAFEVGMNRGDETHAALVEFEAPRVTLSPTGDVSASREGATVTVTSPEYDDGEHPPSATLSVSRADSTAQVVLAEQVMRRRNRGLRNTLAFFGDGVEEVLLRTDEHVVDRTLGDDETRRFRFRGQAYEAKTIEE